MADNTPIEWADATLNYVNGCSVLSPGCTNCYAMKLAGTRLRNHPSRTGLTQDSKAGPVWTGEVRAHEPALMQALKWKRPRRIFWNAHGDLFHENVPDEWIDRLFAVCAMTPQHTHMILTKRSGRMREYFEARREGDPWAEAADYVSDLIGMEDHPWVLEPGDLPLPNVWLGVSVEDQQRADERREDFAKTPAAIKFVSYEPALGPVDWEGWEFVDQIIGGGESGPKARPAHPDWFRGTLDFCRAHGIAYFHKQNGEFAPGEIAGDYLNPDKPAKGMTYFDGRWDEDWSHPEGHADDEPDVYRVGKKRAGRLLDGREWNEVPA